MGIIKNGIYDNKLNHHWTELDRIVKSPTETIPKLSFGLSGALRCLTTDILTIILNKRNSQKYIYRRSQNHRSTSLHKYEVKLFSATFLEPKK